MAITITKDCWDCLFIAYDCDDDEYCILKLEADDLPTHPGPDCPGPGTYELVKVKDIMSCNCDIAACHSTIEL